VPSAGDLVQPVGVARGLFGARPFLKHQRGNAFQFRVIDQGPGIPPEHKNQLFEKFKQVEGISSTKLKGTGLGLAICKAIVQGHNGEIGVESEVGKGTTFLVSLPAKDAQ